MGKKKKPRFKNVVNGGGPPPPTSDSANSNEEIDMKNNLGNSKRKLDSPNATPIKKRSTAGIKINDSETSSSSGDEGTSSNTFKSSSMEINIVNQEEIISPAKYTTKDNGPFVVYAKQEKIKETTLARVLKRSGIINIINIYRVNDNILKIMFKDKVNANRTLDCTTLHQYEFFIPEMYTTTYGVIRNVELDIDITELKGEIRAEVPITNIERIKKYDHMTKTLSDTTLIKIAFRSAYLPRKVLLYDGLVKEVNFFLPRPMFCTECVSYGHMKKKCRSKVKRCQVCGEEIINNEHICQGQNCRFCLEKHVTNSKNCEERNIQIKIRNTMTVKKTTYREAKKIVAEKFNVIPEKNIETFPNLSLNTARINNLSKLSEIVNDLKSKHDILINLIDSVKQKLSNVHPNHPGNDQILIEISILMQEHEKLSK